MEKRLGFIGIIIEDRENYAKEVNAVISEFVDFIIARTGVPYREKSIAVITLSVDIDTDTLGRFTGKLGEIPSVQVKSALGK